MMQSISAATRICGLIGDPVAHSLSPAIQNAAFKETNADYVYLPFRVVSADLPNAIAGLRGLGICGVNVTIPHKIAVMPLLDELEPLAEKIGAVNTIVNNNGHLKGYNTDATGFLKSLEERNFAPAGEKAVILGGGGVSRAITLMLAAKGAQITILNRSGTLEQVKRTASNVSRQAQNEISVIELNENNLKRALADADILINATNVGMHPNTEESLVLQSFLRPEMIVYDVIYNPEKTKLILDAEKVGAKAIGGLDLLVWQGAIAFELWTGIKAPVDVMRNAAATLL
ncbi:MAG: shikimate dehydrogenase [Dehalococcoidales bacterium]